MGKSHVKPVGRMMDRLTSISSGESSTKESIVCFAAKAAVAPVVDHQTMAMMRATRVSVLA
jgi:hypothetical protein